MKGHYFYLRRSLALKKAYKNHQEDWTKRRMVNDILHKIGRAIVNEALEKGFMMVLGDLKGIRRDSKSRRFNKNLTTGSHTIN